MRNRMTGVTIAVCLALLGAGCAAAPAQERLPDAAATSAGAALPTSTTGREAAASAPPAARVAERRARRPLRGVRIVLDPGHQLGNRNFPAQVNRPVTGGGLTKACNTTGTATNGGFPEATFNFRVARLTAQRLRRLGATVRMTRTTNRADRWGPCIDVRGRAGNKRPRADLKISIHADGNTRAGARGFHVIAPSGPSTAGIQAPSRRLAITMRNALRRVLPVSNYLGRAGLDFRGDLMTLNLSAMPVVMVELGNMRHPTDAALMTRAPGRRAYAKALARGARVYLDR